MSDSLSLYIHIPFCVRKCPYCDFYSVDRLSLKPVFIRSLLKEISLRAVSDVSIDTLYFGGGTPSVLTPEELEIILDALHANFRLSNHCEVTLEINPGTLRRGYLSDLKALGINRVNIGIQSFQDEKLKFLGRIHTAAQACAALDAAAHHGFNSIGLDLIYGLPDETWKGWVKDLETAMGFSPGHLSCYLLSIEPGTVKYTEFKNGLFEPLDQEKTSRFFIRTSNYLRERGYLHYEISNFALGPDLRSRHNSRYWGRAPYIGLGPAAHSFNKKSRSWNHRDIIQYSQDLANRQLPVAEKEDLTVEQVLLEIIMLGLRTSEGVDIDAFDKVSKVPFNRKFHGLICDLKARSWAKGAHQGFSLTRAGMTYLDGITEKFAGILLS